MTQWFVGKNNQHKGPFSEDQIKGFIAAGKLDGSSIVWHEGMAEWSQLDLTELEPHLSAAPAAPMAAPAPQAGQPARIPAPMPMGQAPQAQAPMGQAPQRRAPMGQMAGQGPAFSRPAPGANPYAANMNVPQGNGMATTGMILGIVGLVLFWTFWLGGIIQIVGIIFSILGLSKAKKITNAARASGFAAANAGKGKALTGLICSSVGLLVTIAMVIFLVVLVNDLQDDPEFRRAMQENQRRNQQHNGGF